MELCSTRGSRVPVGTTRVPAGGASLFPDVFSDGPGAALVAAACAPSCAPELFRGVSGPADCCAPSAALIANPVQTHTIATTARGPANRGTLHNPALDFSLYARIRTNLPGCATPASWGAQSWSAQMYPQPVSPPPTSMRKGENSVAS